ncbi:hypothetical protein HanPSC8_Chr14g0613931 [Helianthus annuus]|nr:hypothetical protein HanPSC8_Chr14g0613931 [Helianthus annuus]
MVIDTSFFVVQKKKILSLFAKKTSQGHNTLLNCVVLKSVSKMLFICSCGLRFENVALNQSQR